MQSTLSMQRQLKGSKNIDSFLQWTARSFGEGLFVKTESKVTVICSCKTEAKVAKKFKRKHSIPIQFCLSKNNNIQIHQCIEMLQDLNTNTCSCLVRFMHWAYESHTFNATQIGRFQKHTLVFANEPHVLFYCTFCLWRLHLTPPSRPGRSTTLLWLERPRNKCAKLPTVAQSNNKDPMSWSSYFCLFAPHGCGSSCTSRLWWIAHSKQC